MTPHQITIIQESFAKVAPISDTAAEIFYARLFETTPEVRGLFKADMMEQGAKLMATLGVVVNGLRALDKIVPVAEDLARRHIDYGVQADHYKPVGEALIYTLRQGLGDDFTDDLEEAWTAAYATLSDVMIGAAYGKKEPIH